MARVRHKVEHARCVAVDLQARAVKHIQKLSLALSTANEKRETLERKLQVTDLMKKSMYFPVWG